MGAIQDAQYKKAHMHEFDADGIHKETGTEYDKDGFNREGYDCIGFNRAGITGFGYDAKGRNTEPYYDYDVDERKERRQEKQKEIRAEDKFWDEKMKTYKVATKKRTMADQTNNTYLHLLESKLEKLRQKYRDINHDKTLSENEKRKQLSEIHREGNNIKKLMEPYQKR